MFNGEQPLHSWEQKAISRAARRCARSDGAGGRASTRRGDGAIVNAPARRQTSATAAGSRRTPLKATIEQRLVTLFAD